MSRRAFTIGLLISALLHVSLLRCSAPTPAASNSAEEPLIAQVMETELPEPELPEQRKQPEQQEQPKQEQPPPPPEPATPEEVPQPEPAAAPVPSEPPAPPEPPEPAKPAKPAKPEKTAEAERAPEPADLERVAEAEPVAPMESEGDFRGRADARERPPDPELRIDWGSEAVAIETLRVGDMKLAILKDAEPRPIITSEARWEDDLWTRTPYRAGVRTRYSNRLRVVDNVPAFQRVRRELDLSADERLVVLVPTSVERMLESEQLATVFQRGLGLEEVRRFGGRFTLERSSLGFEITRLEARSE